MGGPGAASAPSDPARAEGPTLRIVHMTGPGPAPSPDGTRLLIVAAPVGAVLPDGAGRIGGPVLQLSYPAPQPLAFRVLADCARILPRIDDAAGAGLSYVLDGHAETDPGEGREVAWRLGPDGAVSAFRLSAAAMGDPLLGPATEVLAGAALTDERRFAFLAATLAGG